jgi:hypothetical protein
MLLDLSHAQEGCPARLAFAVIRSAVLITLQLGGVDDNQVDKGDVLQGALAVIA